MNDLPRVAKIVQEFNRPVVEAIPNAVEDCFDNAGNDLPDFKGKRICVGVGSRGVTNLAEIVRAVIENLKTRGAQPFIVPAMGSHGGGTPEGQTKILAGYGVTSDSIGVAIKASLETVRLGETADGVPAFMARTAFDADGVVLVNRVKPHTDFQGEVESGILKMITIGLGKIDGADAFHSSTMIFPHDRLIRTISEQVLKTGKLLCGIAILENAFHETGRIELLPAAGLYDREKELLVEARKLMPSLPIEKADILIIDQIGKDISGAGMDPNITGRWFKINARWQQKPDITRIVVLDLTDSSGGNAVGIGLADFCSERVVGKMDRRATYLNAVTSRNTAPAQIPPYFDSDQETIECAMRSLRASADARNVRLLRIRDTLTLNELDVSEALLEEMKDHPRVKNISGLREMRFDGKGRLI